MTKMKNRNDIYGKFETPYLILYILYQTICWVVGAQYVNCHFKENKTFSIVNYEFNSSTVGGNEIKIKNKIGNLIISIDVNTMYERN